MNFKTIQDALKEIVQALQISTIFPAGLFVFANTYFILPGIIPGIDWADSSILAALSALTVMLSYAFYAFNYPLTRLFEGYKFKELGWFPRLLNAYELSMRDLKAQIHEILDELDRRREPAEGQLSVKYAQWSIGQLKAENNRLEDKLESEYPASDGMVLPTRLGNVIAAFESYSATRYGMDSVALWPRLVPLLQENSYLKFVAQEKSVFDFLMNTCVVVAVLGVELTYLQVYLGQIFWAAFTLGISLLAVLTLYRGMIVAARQWGMTVRVAFDLYRYRLGQTLGIRMHKGDSFADEFKRWQLISHFFLYRRQGYSEWFNQFKTQAEILEQLESKPGPINK